MFQKVRWFIVVACLCVMGCGENAHDHSPRSIRLATTTSTVGSGLLKELLPAFTQHTGIHVTVLAKGTGAALRLAQEGGADVVLVHARKAENDFIQLGYGTNRHDVMYNDFILLGPANDPAQLSGGHDVVEALSAIQTGQFRFVSRGDDSGTHKRERQLWSILGESPEGEWYASPHIGMLDALNLASERSAYILSDRSTYLFNRDQLDLEILIEGDRRLHNPYGVIAVNPSTIEGVDFPSAMEFIDFLTGETGQGIIRNHGVSDFGEPLFVPMVVKAH